MTTERTAGLLLLLLALGACRGPAPPPSTAAATPPETTMNALTPEEAAQGWRLLFDGRTTEGWRGYQQAAVPAGWQVEDGTLTRVGDAGDLITVDQFTDFELSLEWKVETGGNSGVFYRATEDPEWIYHVAPEMQVLDDANHADGASPLTSAGAAYGLYPVPPGAVKPAGEWNAARVRIEGNRVEHWLNGVQTAAYELGSPDWLARVQSSKFVDWPGYGRAPRGHIGIQDHGDRVWYRNIKIREIS